MKHQQLGVQQMKTRLCIDVEFNGGKTDGEAIATALDNVVNTGMSALGDCWDEYGGTPKVGQFLVLDTINESELPKPNRRGKTDPHGLTIRVPVEVSFTTDPVELDDRKGEKKPTKTSLVKYLEDALRLDIDTDDEGQPEGAAFTSAGVDWGKAELIKG
jgi:hypothetical protein